MTFHFTAPIFDGDPACAEVGGDEWFPETGGTGKNMVKAARLICNGCEIQAPCLRWALDNAEPYGVWGGLTEIERRRISGRRRRAA